MNVYSSIMLFNFTARLFKKESINKKKDNVFKSFIMHDNKEKKNLLCENQIRLGLIFSYVRV